MGIPKKKLNDGNEIPMIGLGTWQMDEEGSLSAIPVALELGYRSIDTAYAYYNEKFIGQAIKSFPRDELFLTSKLWREFHDLQKIEAVCDQSLKDLGTDYLDLYLIHWPEKRNMGKILEKMHRIKEKGKIKSIGICNATITHLEELIKEQIPVAVNQVEYHPLLNQDALLVFCVANNIVITAYSPIARGLVSNEGVLVEIGKKYKKSAVQVTLRWLIQKGIVAIPKAVSRAHLKENIDVFDFSLSDVEMGKIESINQNHRMIHPDFNEFS